MKLWRERRSINNRAGYNPVISSSNRGYSKAYYNVWFDSTPLIRLTGGLVCFIIVRYWGCSSSGRAVALQAKGSRFDPDHLHQIIGESSMSQKDVLDRAYGSIPKEVTPGFELFDWLPTWRGVKYYWYKLIRKITR